MLKFTKAELPTGIGTYGMYVDLINQFKKTKYPCVKVSIDDLKTPDQIYNRAYNINAKIRKMGEPFICCCRSGGVYLCTKKYYNEKRGFVG